MNELTRTSSNNMTRQLYSLILKRLSKCPEKKIRGRFYNCLRKGNIAIKQRKGLLRLQKYEK